ncbi:MAG: ribosome assembly cofactor RimP, partial [Odoribacter sp.]|nr:ribosome assembly cofactor RimP [Odoribacter sp.]
VDISTCSRISRELEARLDREKEDFELTVSSAGIGYPFKVPGQYLKNIGKKVSVKLVDASRLEGILQSYTPTEIVLACEEKRPIEGKKKKELVKVEKRIPLEQVKEIKDIVSF